MSETSTNWTGGLEKRREKQAAVKLPLHIRQTDGREETGVTKNLSRGGACFVSNLPLAEGETIYFTIGNLATLSTVSARVDWREFMR
jgi:hypothetical protein